MKKLLILTLFFSSCSRSPNQIFEAIFDEIPESVKIINGQDQLPLDCCLWLHFEISEDDFNLITEDYIEIELDYERWTGVLPVVDWWNPSKFKEEGIYLERESNDARMIEGVFTNKKRTEVFYVNWYN